MSGIWVLLFWERYPNLKSGNVYCVPERNVIKMSRTVIDAYQKLNSPVKESYETLKANIQLYDFGTKIKSLTVTSYRAREGKTTTACNLAIVMAMSGLKVLLVDADLHKPELMKDLKGKNFLGLSNILLGYSTLSEAVNSTSVEGFHYISCGIMPLNPAGLLGSSRFKDFLSEACERYDIVIFDTPPLGSVTDSRIVASQTDGAIFVIQPGKTSYKNLKMIKNQLQKSKINLLGAVLNKIPADDYRDYQMEYDYFGSKKKYSKERLDKIRKKGGIRSLYVE